VALFASGTLILPGETTPCAPAALTIRAPAEAELTLTEGRYHQVRRMFSSQGWTVLALHRERFGQLELGDLPAGRWRDLPLDIFSSALTRAGEVVPSPEGAAE
jgi:16S rRNA pseudouridine516 synthase